ncbi:MAG: TlpA disulfide reductase family protein [Candidatus Omnitrophota bacterium]
MKKLTIFLLAFSLMTFVVGCGNTQAEKPASGDRASDFELTHINGDKIKLSDHAGKIIILNFFATWCPPCRNEMPDFDTIAKENKGTVEVIAVNVGREPLAKVQDFAKSNNLSFSIVMDDGKVSNVYGPIRAIPVTVVIDKDFNIARRYIGMRTKEVFIKDIEDLS